MAFQHFVCWAGNLSENLIRFFSTLLFWNEKKANRKFLIKREEKGIETASVHDHSCSILIYIPSYSDLVFYFFFTISITEHRTSHSLHRKAKWIIYAVSLKATMNFNALKMKAKKNMFLLLAIKRELFFNVAFFVWNHFICLMSPVLRFVTLLYITITVQCNDVMAFWFAQHIQEYVLLWAL